MAENELLMGFYGDDFTGSTDAMDALTRAGLRTVCFVTPPTQEIMKQYVGLGAFGVAGISRALNTSEMATELQPAFKAMMNLQIPLVHYKTCSTFDSSPEIGSIGKAIDIGCDIFSPPYVPVMVGAPPLGRYCVFGNLFARSGADTEPFRLDRHPTMSRHPITLMDESDLRLHLGKQTKKRLSLFNVLELYKPIEDAEQSLSQLLTENPDIVVFDTLYEDQLVKLGRLISSHQESENPLFVVGSSGVESALTAYWQSQGLISPKPFADPGKVDQLLVLSGSCSPVTERQIEWGLENGAVEIPVQTERIIMEDQKVEECEHTAKKALDLLDQGHNVIVHTARGPKDPRIEATSQRLKDQGFSDTDLKLKSGKFFGEALAEIFKRIFEKKNVRRAAIFGGDTCGYFARSMDIEAIEMIGPLAPGAPLCRVHKPGSPLENVEILFKGGQLGNTEIVFTTQQGKP